MIYIQYTYLNKRQCGHHPSGIASSKNEIIFIHEESILTWRHELFLKEAQSFWAQESSRSNHKATTRSSGIYGTPFARDHLVSNGRTQATIVGKVYTIGKWSWHQEDDYNRKNAAASNTRQAESLALYKLQAHFNTIQMTATPTSTYKRQGSISSFEKHAFINVFVVTGKGRQNCEKRIRECENRQVSSGERLSWTKSCWHNILYGMESRLSWESSTNRGSDGENRV